MRSLTHLEWVTLKQSLIMDKFAIKTPGLPLLQSLDRLFDKDANKSSGGHKRFPVYSIPGTFDWPLTRWPEGNITARFRMGPRKALKVFAKRENDHWFATKIEGNLLKLLYGHNSISIRTQHEFLVGLTRFYDVVSWIVPEPWRFRILPGLGQNNTSYWSKIEFPVHVPDPDRRLFSALQHVRHQGMRLAAWRCDAESLKLQGGTKSINIYLKDVEVAKKHSKRTLIMPSEPVLRIECAWAKEDLAKRAKPHGRMVGPEQPGSRRLASVSLPQLYSMCRTTLRQTQGTFALMEGDPGKQKPARGHARFLAEIAKAHSIPLSSLLETDARLVKRSDTTRADIRREAEDYLTRFSDVDLDQILPEAAPPWAPIIRIPGIEEEVELMGLATMPRPEIEQAYHDALCSPIVDGFNPNRRFSSISSDALRQTQRESRHKPTGELSKEPSRPVIRTR